MGMIQSSLNQLFLSGVGAVGGVAYGIKGAIKPKAPTKEASPQPQAETTSSMGNIAKIGRNYSQTGSRSYGAAAKAVMSGNDAIAQKASAKFMTPEERIAQIKAATGLSVIAPKTEEKKGGSN